MHIVYPIHESAAPSVILELIDPEPLHSQEQLRRRLHQAGFEATQATISRDIKELGLVKRAGDGAYQRAGVEAENPATALAPSSTRRRVPAARGTGPAAGHRAHRCWAGATARRSPSIARSCPKPSARSPGTTRFSSSRKTGAVPQRSSSESAVRRPLVSGGFQTPREHDGTDCSRVLGRARYLGRHSLAQGALWRRDHHGDHGPRPGPRARGGARSRARHRRARAHVLDRARSSAGSSSHGPSRPTRSTKTDIRWGPRSPDR